MYMPHSCICPTPHLLSPRRPLVWCWHTHTMWGVIGLWLQVGGRLDPATTYFTLDRDLWKKKLD